MKKILIAFLMSIISLGSITTPTFADDNALFAAAERLANNRANKSKQTHVQNCNAILKKTKDIVGSGSTPENAEKEWRTNAKLFLKQYCINPLQRDTYVSCNNTGGGAITNCNDTCGDANEINRFAREICQNILVQTKKDDPGIKFDQFDLSVPAVVTTQDNTYGYIARLQGSTAMPDVTITKSAPTPAQPTASITGKVVDEYGEPAIVYVYLQQNNQDLKNSKGNLVVAPTRSDDGFFEIPGYTWEPDYSLRISTMGQDMIIHYNDQHDLNTPIIFKLPEDENVNMINEIDIANTIKQGNDCQIINSNGTKTAGSIQYAYPNDKSKTNSFACKPTICEHKTYKATKLTNGTYEYDITQTSFVTGQPETWTEQENGHIFECELDKSLDPRGNECKDIKTFDPHATDGTIVEWDEKTGEVTQCTSTTCEKGFEIVDTSSTYIDKNSQSQKIQLCEQTTCPKELIKEYNEPHAKEWAVDEMENHLAKTCKVIECDSDNGWKPSQLTPTKCVRTNQCPCGTHWAWPDEHPQQQEGCISNDGDADCTKEKIGAETAHYGCDSKGKTTCIIDSCLDGWNLNKNNSKPEKNICINQLDCLTWGKEQDKTQKTDKYKNATVASWDDDKHTICKIMACDKMYRVDKNANACVLKNTEDQETLQANLDKARENEKSLQNRINGAVGIGGVGFGGMMIGGALSERAADDYAESDMAAYINTFMCDYGDGNTVRGGQTNVEIPGGNELIDLYARYARLANDLKLRKESLGIKPGIESEVIIDKASTGLYDDVGTGVVGGGYASIARAIMNPNGPDAAMWAAQRAATTSKLNTGIGIATTAAALTLANNIAGNRKPPADLFQSVQQVVNQIPEPVITCEDPYGLTGTYPHCDCGEGSAFIGGEGEVCRQCLNNEIVITDEKGNQDCGCADGFFHDRQERKCFTKSCGQRGITTTINDHPRLHVDENTCEFYCEFPYNRTGEPGNYSCECPINEGYQETANGCKAVVSVVKNVTIDTKTFPRLVLTSDKTFDFDKAVLKPEGKTSLDNFAKQLVEDYPKLSNCKFTITGHTDKVGRDTYNENLSRDRANAAKNYLEKESEYSTKFNKKASLTIDPKGEKECTCVAKSGSDDEVEQGESTACKGKKVGQTPSDKPYEPCRRVEITGTCDETQTVTTTTTETHSGSLAQ